jgi:hypothetical protein
MLFRRTQRRRRPMAGTLPDWARFFKGRLQLERFELLVGKYFRQRGIGVVIRDGWVTRTDAPGDTGWGLRNLGQACAASPADSWAGVIAKHFDSALSLGTEGPLTLHQAADRVMIRLWDERSFPPGPWVDRVDIPGIRTALCLDLDSATRVVKRQELDAWGVEPAEMFMQAFANLRERVKPSVESLEPRSAVRVISSEDGYYGGALMVDVDRFAGEFGRYGAIASIPTRALGLLAPCNDAGAAQSLKDMVAMTVGCHRDGPGSVSANVYWYYRRRWRQVPYEFDGSECRFHAPEELVGLLDGVISG